MSLWGNKELVADAGTVAINLSTGAVTGSGTSFSTGGDHAVKAGDVFVVGTGATMGYGVVVDDPTSATEVTVTTGNLIANTGESNILEGATYYVTQMPSYVTHSAGLRAPEAKSNRTDVIYGVDSGEQDAANAASGDARKYAAPHAGWVGVTTYIQTNTDGTTELRVKTEVLVAGGADSDGNGGIASDADREDTTYTG